MLLEYATITKPYLPIKRDVNDVPSLATAIKWTPVQQFNPTWKRNLAAIHQPLLY